MRHAFRIGAAAFTVTVAHPSWDTRNNKSSATAGLYSDYRGEGYDVGGLAK
jgi:hypothetical protein